MISTNRLFKSVKTTVVENAQVLAKKKMKADLIRRQINSLDPQKHPLFMNFPVALKILRAAEVGRNALQTTISLYITVVSDKGVKNIEGSFNFPFGFKKNQILFLTKSAEMAEKSIKLGVKCAGGTEIINQIRQDQFELKKFDCCLASHDIVPEFDLISKQLGTMNFYPSEKKQTLSNDIDTMISHNLERVFFKQHDHYLSFPVGRCDMSDLEIFENLKLASNFLYKFGSEDRKQPLIGKTFLSSTSGPSILIDFKKFL